MTVSSSWLPRPLAGLLPANYQLLPSSEHPSPTPSRRSSASTSASFLSSPTRGGVSMKRSARLLLVIITASGAAVVSLVALSTGSWIAVSGGSADVDGLLAGAGGSTLEGDAHSSPPTPMTTAATAAADVPEQPEPDDQAQLVWPIIHLPTPLLLPSASLLSYPAPSVACLDHLHSLASSSGFNASLCPPSTTIEPLDVVSTFVNGTDTLFLAAYDDAIAHQFESIKPPERHYGNMGELRFGLRSIARNLIGPRAEKGTVHVVGSDFAGEAGEERRGQIPWWLDWRAVSRPWDDAQAVIGANEGKDPYEGLEGNGILTQGEQRPRRNLSWAFHSEIFLGKEEWRAKALPTFNSFAIESQVHNVPGLASTFVSMNDDFFLLRPLSSSDFHSSLFGPTFRVQSDLAVKANDRARVGDGGEWGGLEWAAFVLSRRHPSPPLEYLAHLPKTLTRPHLHELSLTFRDAISAASMRKFREQKTGGADIEIAFLATHYIRQRHREALLWSYIVARPAPRLTWGRVERAELQALAVDGWKGRAGEGLKDRSAWTGGEVNNVLETGGEEAMMATEVEFSSLTGLPVLPFGQRWTKLSLAECLGEWWTSPNEDAEVDSEELFRRLAFENPQCGNALITAVLSNTTLPGLNALLPSASAVFTPSKPQNLNSSTTDVYSVPHLPLTPTWEEARFSLPDILPSPSPTTTIPLRPFCLSLLARYRHSLGTTPSRFAFLTSFSSMASIAKSLAQSPETALLALNDDLGGRVSRVKVSEQLAEWGGEKWGGKEKWEREDR